MIFDYWKDAARLKARGLTEARHGWGVKPEGAADSDEDDQPEDKAAKKDKAKASPEGEDVQVFSSCETF